MYEGLMGQSNKIAQDGLQPQTIYRLTPRAKEIHPKKVVFNPPSLLRQEANLQDERKARTQHLIEEEKKRDADVVKR